jgi:prepilin-type N-terminal cleavage/methylation domain-containing protein
MRRHTKAEGYTLVELLIVTAIVGMVAAGIVGVYQVSQGIYTRATALEDAQLGARAGLDRMASELRLIGAYWSGAAGAGPAITAATATNISFRADVDADTLNVAGQEITLTAPAVSGNTSISVNRTTGSIGGNAFTASEWVHVANGARREVKQIAAEYGTGLTIPLTTALTSSFPGSPQPAIVRSVETITYDLNGTSLRRNGFGIVENVNGLTLTYFGATGNLLGSPPDLAQIREIQMSLTTQGTDGSRRTMTSRVRSRNLP